jgi:putative DNA-invertase from lambdoid prophage Rac
LTSSCFPVNVQKVYVPFFNVLSYHFDKRLVKQKEYTQLGLKYALAYLRVSTEEQTVLNQKIALRKWADAQSYLILDFFEDSAISGKIPAIKRRGFQDMLDILGVAAVDAVLVYELSRIGRTFWDTLDSIKAIEEYAPLISCSSRETFLQSTEPSVRKLMIGILTWVAEREREMLVQRTKDGMARARAAGKGIGRPQINLDKNSLINLLVENQPRAKIAKTLGISKATLYKWLREISIKNQ